MNMPSFAIASTKSQSEDCDLSWHTAASSITVSHSSSSSLTIGPPFNVAAKSRTYKSARKRTANRKDSIADTNPSLFQQQATLAIRYPNLPSPIRSHAVHFIFILKDIFKRSSMKLVKNCRNLRVYSLASLSAFCIGDHMENIEDVDEQMELYEVTPAHYRRQIFLQHVIHLCTAHIKVLPIVNELLDIVSKSGANHQVLFISF
jgi:hypothetical protein